MLPSIVRPVASGFSSKRERGFGRGPGCSVGILEPILTALFGVAGKEMRRRKCRDGGHDATEVGGIYPPGKSKM